MTLYLGVDIASVDANKPVDWQVAKAAGVRFAFFRGSYAAWSDPTFKNESVKARDVGVTVGAYLFPLFGKSAPQPGDQIAAFLRGAKLQHGRDFVPVLDVEFPGGIRKTGRTRLELLNDIVYFIALLRTELGTAPMIYTSARVWDGEDDDALDADRLLGIPLSASVARCPLWLARYPYKTRIPAVGDDAAEKPVVEKLAMPPVPKAWGAGNVWVHQYQGDAIKMPGFSSTVDLNRFFDLKRGDTGQRVAWLRYRFGYNDVQPMLHPVFDAGLEALVKKFQAEQGLVADGIVGPKTFAALAWY